MLEAQNRPRNRNRQTTDGAQQATRQLLAGGGPDVREIPLEDIEDNELQTRLFWGRDELARTGESIEQDSQLQPIGVIELGEDSRGRMRYRILFGTGRVGGRRQQGAQTIEARIFHDVAPDDYERQYDIIVAENSQRKNLTPYEDCRAVAIYKDRFNRTFDYIADRFNISQSQAENRYYAWRDSDPKKNGGDDFLRNMLRHPNTMSLVQLVRRIPTKKLQKETVERIIHEGLTAEAVRTIIKTANQGEDKKDTKQSGSQGGGSSSGGSSTSGGGQGSAAASTDGGGGYTAPPPVDDEEEDPFADDEEQAAEPKPEETAPAEAEPEPEPTPEPEEEITAGMVSSNLLDSIASLDAVKRTISRALANPYTTPLAKEMFLMQLKQIRDATWEIEGQVVGGAKAE